MFHTQGLKLEYVLLLVVVLVVAAVAISIVAPEYQAQLAEALAPLQGTLQ